MEMGGSPTVLCSARLLPPLVWLLLLFPQLAEAQGPAPPPPRPPPPGPGPEPGCDDGGACTVQELTDRLLTGYSRHTNPLLDEMEQSGGRGCHADPEPNMVDTQIYVTKLGSIDQKRGSFAVEGFFRLWWTDQRLAWDQERTCVRSIQLLDGPSNIWVPDFYFPPSVEHAIGAKNDGQVCTAPIVRDM